jgi:hypothetical protein
VPCYPEKVAFSRIQGRRLEPDWSLVDGSASGDVLAFALAAGIVSGEEAERGQFVRKVRDEEAAGWLGRAAAAAGTVLAEDRLAEIRAETAIEFVRTFAEAFDWSGQRALLEPQDASAAARFRELQGLSGEDLVLALLALKAGILPGGLDPGWTSARLSRGNVLEMLVLWLRRQPGWEPLVGRVIAVRGTELELLQGKDRIRVPLAPGLVTLSSRKGASPRLREVLEVKSGDKVRLLREPAGAATYLALEEDPDGAAYDRLSPYSWWTRRITFADLSAAAARHAEMPGLRDARAAEVSANDRVVALELVGEKGRTRRVEGLAVRTLLGLPDLRADLAFERDSRSRLVAITATGRGWGHGVGLCQFGAFGMALQGATAEEILAHYYPGTELAALDSVKNGDGLR